MIPVAPPSSILILRLSALGDVIHTIPAVVALRRGHPDARIGWLVEAPYRDLVRLVAPVDEVFSASTRRWRRELTRRSTRAEVFTLAGELRRFVEGGTSIDFQGLVKSAIWGTIAGAKERWGFDPAAIRERPASLFINRPVTIGPHQHVVEWNLQLAHAAGGAPGAPLPLDFSRFEQDPAGELEGFTGPGVLVLNPGAGHPAKLWGAGNFRSLAREVMRSFPLTPVVVWGPGEREAAEAIALEPGVRIAPPTSLRQLAYILGRCRLVVAGDTGPLHLAAGMGTPVVGLFGPTNPSRNGPFGQRSACVESYTTTRNLSSISVEAVMNRIAAVLEGK